MLITITTFDLFKNQRDKDGNLIKQPLVHLLKQKYKHVMFLMLMN